MSCAQQNNTNKRPPHAQSVCNFVVTHIGVVAHDQGHASTNAKLVEGFANFFAGTLFDQAFELIGIGSFEWHFGYVFGFFILAKLAAAEQVPAVVGGHLVEPSGEGAAFIVLASLSRNFIKISMVASSASSRVGMARRQKRKIAGAYSR